MTEKDKRKELQMYKAILKRDRERFDDWLGSCTRYLGNKRLKDIKYHG